MKRLYNAALDIANELLPMAKGMPLRHAGIVSYVTISPNIALHFNKRFLAPIEDITILTINHVFFCSEQVRIMGDCHLTLTDGRSFKTAFWFYINREDEDDQETN
jgi:hypothetical protein